MFQWKHIKLRKKTDFLKIITDHTLHIKNNFVASFQMILMNLFCFTVNSAQIEIKLRYCVEESALEIGILRARNLHALFIDIGTQV